MFPKILSQNCDDFNSDNTIYNADQKKSGSLRRHMTSYLSSEVNTYTIEVSLLGYEDPETKQIVSYNDDLYSKVGRNIARAFWDYYKIVGTIPLEDSSDEESGVPKPREQARPKSAGIVTRSFNMDRLREVAKQRKETAETFEVMSDVAGAQRDPLCTSMSYVSTVHCPHCRPVQKCNLHVGLHCHLATSWPENVSVKLLAFLNLSTT